MEQGDVAREATDGVPKRRTASRGVFEGGEVPGLDALAGPEAYLDVARVDAELEQIHHEPVPQTSLRVEVFDGSDPFPQQDLLLPDVLATHACEHPQKSCGNLSLPSIDCE